MKRSLHFALTLSCLIAHLCHATTPSTGTTDFNSLTQSNLTGGNVPTPATVTNVGSLGWDFTATADGGMVSLSAAGAGVTGPTDVCIRFNRATAGFFIISAGIRSNDASAFKLNHVYLKVNLFTGATADMTLTGYRNGVAVPGATKTITGITTNPTWTIFDVSGIPAFNNVTEFRFTQAGSSTAQISFAAIDDIDIASAVPLPLTFGVFSGQRQENTVILNWTTLMEQNTAYFEIQRSADVNNYTPVGKVPAAGNSTSPMRYVFNDDLPVPPAAQYYYRLKMVDLDGHFTYSPIVGVGGAVTSFGLNAFPNPLTSSTTLAASATAEEDAMLTVTDMLGKQVLIRPVHLQKGNNILPLTFFSGLAKGVYQLRLVTQHTTAAIRLLKTD
ncbi:MAG: T9SS type A sorting domain-containing protein [Chitinophagaceae bacterium]|nr:T9SS type A sorting domain-containing protein [Chitinophagaceae bacterium]